MSATKYSVQLRRSKIQLVTAHSITHLKCVPVFPYTPSASSTQLRHQTMETIYFLMLLWTGTK